jgi:hypothetical protein
MPADCGIDRCQVLAIGHCDSCGRAFCASHRAADALFGTPIANQCRNCRSIQEQQKAAEVRASDESWVTLDALGLLKAASVRPVDVYELCTYPVPARFLRKARKEQRLQIVGQGWYVGELLWVFTGAWDIPEYTMQPTLFCPGLASWVICPARQDAQNRWFLGRKEFPSKYQWPEVAASLRAQLAARDHAAVEARSPGPVTDRDRTPPQAEPTGRPPRRVIRRD